MTLTPAQRTGLLRLGDVIIPGDDELPSFSQSGVAVTSPSVDPLRRAGT